MDTRVLLANNNKRYESIFKALGIIDRNATETSEVIYAKLIEVDNKLDAIMGHLGITLPEPEPVVEAVVGQDMAQPGTDETVISEA